MHTYTVQMKLNHNSLGFGIEPPLITTRKFAAESGTLFHPSVRPPAPGNSWFCVLFLASSTRLGVNLSARPIRLSVSLRNFASLSFSAVLPLVLLLVVALPTVRGSTQVSNE